MNHDDFHDDFDERHSEMMEKGKKWAVLGFLLNIVIGLGSVLLLCIIVYFFLAAMGYVPPADVIPILPYV